MDALQAALDALHAQRLFVGLVGRHRKDAAPDAGRPIALDLEQVEPLVGIGEIIAGADSPGWRLPKSKVVPILMKRSAQVKPSNSISARRRTVLEPPSVPIRYLPRSVSVSPAALVTVTSTWSACCASPVTLVEKRTSARPARLDVRQRGAHQLVLLPLQHERVGHLALEQADVEHRDQLAGGAVAEMEQRRRHAAARILGEGLPLEPQARPASPRSADEWWRRAGPRRRPARLPSA